MSDTETEPVDLEDTPPAGVKLCAHCGIRPAGHGRFGKYCDDPGCRAERLGKNEPVAPKPKATPSDGRRFSALEREIKDAVMGTAAVASIANPGIFVAVEATVDEFAVAWANVARHSPTAERYIRALLTSGVWLAAFSATLVMLVGVMVVTNTCPPPLTGFGWYVIGTHPKIGEYVTQQHAARVAATNGNVEAEAT